MSFTKSFRQKVRAVRIRYSLNLLLRQAGMVLALAGAVAVLAVLVERLLAVTVRMPPTLWAFSLAVAMFILIPWFLRMPNRMQASLLLDERLRLSERFSTTLALAESEDPFARAARAESLRVVQQANLKGHFPIGLSRSWFYGAGTWLMAIGLLLYMPQKDLLGFLRQRQSAERQTRQIEMAKAEVKRTTDSVKAAVQRLDDPNLAEDLRKLDELAQSGAPQDVKRQAIKALGDLAEKIKQMQNSTQVGAADMLKQTLKRLHGSVDPFGQKLRLALAKGDFSKAADMLRQMQKELAEGTLSEEMRKKLAEQMQQLAQELQKLAEEKRDLENELGKLGLDKKLAQMSPDQLQQALQKKGLNAELLQKLMKKAEACQSAQGQCAALGLALGAGGAGGGVAGDALSDAIDQLDAMEAWQQQALMLQASLGEIGRCMGGLGAGMGQGSWQIGEGGGQGDGIGLSPAGFYSAPQEIASATKKARTQTQSEGGPAVASWYFKDAQVKGEARREFSQVVQAGRDSAAEAISENQIPRRYEGAVKEYFNQLEASSPQP
jgi:hypothetical protein